MAEKAEFYVGYLKLPRGLAGFLARVVPVLLIATTAVAWLTGRAQNDPGDAVWEEGPHTFTGRLTATPYPVIRILSHRPGGGVQTLLLVAEGKRGAGERAAALDGRVVTVRGTTLERDGRRLLELADGEAITPVEATSRTTAAGAAASNRADRLSIDAPPVQARTTQLSRVTLRGEIIDPKCYSGAMKPGEGKTHKECATLCIAGGIPPMFVTIDAAGARRYYLLSDGQGRALDGRILPFVADAIELSGELERRDDLLLLRIDPASIRRL